MFYGWYSILSIIGLVFIAAAVLMYKVGYKPERREKTVVHVHVHPPRERREGVFRRVKRREEEQRKAYHESEWRHYGDFGPR